MKNKLISVVSLSLIVASGLSAQVVSFTTPGFRTFVSDSVVPGGGFNNNGIWFTVTNGTPVGIADNSFPDLADGQFQLRTVRYNEFIGSPIAAEALVQGLFGNGNNMAMASNNNPAFFAFGASVGPLSQFTAGDGFADLAGNFGNWNALEDLRGALGLQFSNAGETHFGFADITVHTDLTISLNGYAFESTPNLAIETFVIPEPSTYAALFGLAALLFVGLRRRR